MDSYIFTKRHVLNACFRVREKGLELARAGDISTKESIGYSAAALAFAEEMGVKEEYLKDNAPKEAAEGITTP